ncbi:MAG TPA: copper resistance protein CopC [Gaiellales bacterium]
MTTRVRVGVLVWLLVALGLVLPAVAGAHAALLHTTPDASVTTNGSPAQVTLTYSESIEPRFSIISVTNVDGHQVTAGVPARAPGSPQTLEVPLRKLPPGWYLVLWRVISADGHPVRGAFTFAVGPSPGPAPQFVIPSLSESAATPGLVGVRFATFLAVMLSVGLFVFRIVIARPLRRVLPRATLRPVSIAFVASLAVSLVAVPVYLIVSTAKFALTSAFDLGTLIPLVRSSSFGRSYLDLWIVLALFAVSALIAIAIDRPERPIRSTAELFATASALIAGGALLEIPGIAGHAAQTPPAALALVLDWAHLICGSVWIGGLVGLLALWFGTAAAERRAVLARVVPRFSKVAFVSVMLLLTTGVAASYLHLPTLASLWQTSYGKMILIKSGLLAATMLIAAVNLLVTRPRLASTGIRDDLAERAPALLRRLVAGEIVLVVSTILAASVLTSLPPPPKALASIGSIDAHVGPGAIDKLVQHGPYSVRVRISPNRAALPNTFSISVERKGAPVHGAEATMRFTMLDMDEEQQTYTLQEKAPGTYARSAPALVMVGHWGLSFTVTPKGAAPFVVLFEDRASG